MVLAIAPIYEFACPSHRLGAGDDLDQLLGDHRLTGAVVTQRLLANHLARVAGGVVHRSHLRAVERGCILQKRAKDLHRDIARQKVDQDFLLIRLVFVDHAVVVASFALEHGRDDLLSRRGLRDNGLETRKEQGADVERTLFIKPQDFVADICAMLEGECANAAQLDVLEDLLLIQTAKLFVALATYAEELHVFAFGRQCTCALARKPHDRRVEWAAQPALGGAHKQEMHAAASCSNQQSRRRATIAHRGSNIAEHLRHLLGIGTRGLGRGLRTSQFGGRDHLHGLGNLLRRPGGGDAHAHVFEARHFRCDAENERATTERESNDASQPSIIGDLASILRLLSCAHANVFAYSSTAALSLAAVASSRSRLSQMSLMMSECFVRARPSMPSSKARTRSTWIGSR